MLLEPHGRSSIRRRLIRAKLGRFAVTVAFVLLGAIYIAGLIIRMQNPFRG
jgi:hypothetical protein